LVASAPVLEASISVSASSDDLEVSEFALPVRPMNLQLAYIGAGWAVSAKFNDFFHVHLFPFQEGFHSAVG